MKFCLYSGLYPNVKKVKESDNIKELEDLGIKDFSDQQIFINCNIKPYGTVRIFSNRLKTWEVVNHK